MLPPNATSLIQPLDQGVIAMVKARYRKWYLRWMLAQDNLANGIVDAEQQAASDTDEEQDNERLPVRPANGAINQIKPSVRRGIRKLARVWRNVEPVHIFNCWRKTEIMPSEWLSLYEAPSQALLQGEYEELGHLIASVHANPIRQMNALEYVHDVCGENEREPLRPEEDGSPSSSLESSTIRQSTSGCAVPQHSIPAQATTAGSAPICTHQHETALSPSLTGRSTEESRIFHTDSHSQEWDDIQLAQDPDWMADFFDLDLNQCHTMSVGALRCTTNACAVSVG